MGGPTWSIKKGVFFFFFLSFFLKNIWHLVGFASYTQSSNLYDNSNKLRFLCNWHKSKSDPKATILCGVGSVHNYDGATKLKIVLKVHTIQINHTRQSSERVVVPWHAQHFASWIHPNMCVNTSRCLTQKVARLWDSWHVSLSLQKQIS